MRLYDLYVIYRDGRNIFHKNFCHSELDSSIISGFLTALSDFAKEALPSNGSLKEIEKGDIKLIFNHGKYLTIAIVSESKNENDTVFLNNRIKNLTIALEKEFQEPLNDWNGDLNNFEGIENLVEETLRETIRFSIPPTIEELVKGRDYYFYSADEDGINIYEIFYQTSWSFQAFLKSVDIQINTINELLSRLKNTKLSLSELKKEYNFSLNTLLKILRHLALRGIISVCG